ncbi:MAG: type III secretion system outer membrane ring subunit SctC [Pseudomonadota bacterium]
MLAVVAVLLWARPLDAQWPDRNFSYIAVDQDVQQVLRDFAATQDISIVISNNVGGRISGNFVNVPPQQFIEEMARLNGLIWYLFGGVLYVYDASETESHILSLSNTPAELFRQSLVDIGIFRDRFAWRADPALNIVLVSGPPRYVDLVEQIGGVVERQRASQPRVELFRLQHASAIDRVVTYRDQEFTVAGVTTMLRELFGLAEATSNTRRTRSAALTGLPGVPGMNGQAFSSQGQSDASAATNTQTSSGSQAAPTSANASSTGNTRTDGLSASLAFSAPDEISIESDSRLNAVLVKARSDQLPFIATLIQQLDVATRLIQIDVTIIDLTVTRLAELGVEWSLFDGISIGTQSAIAEGINAGLQIAGSISNPFEIVADIRALEQLGEAKIVSQPSVITFDNVEAIIDESETIHIRVAGNEDVDLFQVETGTLLRVTPRLVQVAGNPRREVELFVDIRDGTFDDTRAVDEIPAVLESTLTTSAIVEAQQGLLLGGLYRSELQDTEEKVPLLGDIPILGLAFRSKSSSQTEFARLFLITPSPIVLSPNTSETLNLQPIPNTTPGTDGNPTTPGTDGNLTTPNTRLPGEPDRPTRSLGAPQRLSAVPERLEVEDDVVAVATPERLEVRDTLLTSSLIIDDEVRAAGNGARCMPQGSERRTAFPGILTMPQIVDRLNCLSLGPDR